MPNKTMENIIQKYPWIAQKDQKLIISPDSDGFLSALLLMNYFDAKVVGYYDCKVMLCDASVDPKDCTFVDLDIFCKDIKSVGHHMVCYNKLRKPSNWYHYDNCIQVNNLRDFDSKNNFQQKYPLGTIHFLLSLLETVKPIKMAPKAIIPLFFCDGVCNNLFGYPENCLEWLKWLNANDPKNILYNIFYRKIPVSTVMELMDEFFKARDSFNSTCYYDINDQCVKEKKRSRSGHHMILSLSDGTPVNIIKNPNNTYDIFEQERKRILGFIGLMADFIGWNIREDLWNFSNLKLYKFQKENMNSLSSSSQRLNQSNYTDMVEKDCFSMAITASTTIEYTRDINGYFK